MTGNPQKVSGGKLKFYATRSGSIVICRQLGSDPGEPLLYRLTIMHENQGHVAHATLDAYGVARLCSNLQSLLGAQGTVKVAADADSDAGRAIPSLDEDAFDAALQETDDDDFGNR